MILYAEKIVDSAALKSLLPEWEALDAQMSPRTPFTSPTWTQLWWQHFRRHSILSRDELSLHALRNENGKLIAVAPLMITHKPAFWPLQLRVLQFIGADPSITEVRGVVCRPEHQELVISTMIKHFSAHQNEWDIFLWRGLRNVGSSPDVVGKLPCLQMDDYLPSYFIDLPDNWEKLAAGLSSNMRKSIRKSYEFLERDGYKFAFRSRSHPNEVGEALDRFFVLHAARSLAKDMKVHPDRFSTRKHNTMLVDFSHKMAERGQFQMFELEVSDAIVATRIAFRLGDDLYLYYSGYNPDWKKYSVMTTLMAEIIKWAMQRSIKRINLSTGTDLGKLRWRPTEVLYHNAVQASPTLRGRLANRAYDFITSLRSAQNSSAGDE